MKKIFIALSVILMIGCDSVSTAANISTVNGIQTITRSDNYILNLSGSGNTITLDGGTVHLNISGVSNLIIVNANTTIAECNISGISITLDLSAGVSGMCNDSGIGTTILR